MKQRDNSVAAITAGGKGDRRSRSTQTLVDPTLAELERAFRAANRAGGAQRIAIELTRDVVLEAVALRVRCDLSVSVKVAEVARSAVAGRAPRLELVGQPRRCRRSSPSAPILSVSRPSASLGLDGGDDGKDGALVLRSTRGAGAVVVLAGDLHASKFVGVRFEDNRSSTGGGAVSTSGSALFVRCALIGNRARTRGGAVWAGAGLALDATRVIGNAVVPKPVAGEEAPVGGGGVYVRDGGLRMEGGSALLRNEVRGDAGNAGGAWVERGPTVLTGGSAIDENEAFDAGGLLQGSGDVALLEGSSASGNRSFDPGTGRAGGGGIVINAGDVLLSHSRVCDNRTVGMYSGGIVSLKGSVTLVRGSEVCRNRNAGPGGGIACNLDARILVDDSRVSGNVGASLGGGIANFSPQGGSVCLANGAEVSDNRVTDAQDIAGTFEALLSMLPGRFGLGLPAPIGTAEGDGAGRRKRKGTVAGGGIASFFGAPVSVLGGSTVARNVVGVKAPSFECGVAAKTSGASSRGGAASKKQPGPTDAGQKVSVAAAGNEEEEPVRWSDDVTSLGGGIFVNGGPLTVVDSFVTANRCLLSGGGAWANGPLLVTSSTVAENEALSAGGRGGGLLSVPTEGAHATLVGSTFSRNSTGGRGGGVAALGPATLIGCSFVSNVAAEGGGGLLYDPAAQPVVLAGNRFEGNVPDDVATVGRGGEEPVPALASASSSSFAAHGCSKPMRRRHHRGSRRSDRR